MLNDAVAITLYKTFLGFFNKPVTLAAVAGGFRTFCLSFIGSMTIGTPTTALQIYCCPLNKHTAAL